MHKDEMIALVEDVLGDLKAREVCVMDVSELTSITDYMVVASGTSSRHVRGIADRIVERLKESGVSPIGIEGHDFGEWVLVDLDDVVVHLMQPATREFYKLENLWDMEAQARPGPDSPRAEPGG